MACFAPFLAHPNKALDGLWSVNTSPCEEICPFQNRIFCAMALQKLRSPPLPLVRSQPEPRTYLSRFTLPFHWWPLPLTWHPTVPRRCRFWTHEPSSKPMLCESDSTRPITGQVNHTELPPAWGLELAKGLLVALAPSQSEAPVCFGHSKPMQLRTTGRSPCIPGGQSVEVASKPLSTALR